MRTDWDPSSLGNAMYCQFDEVPVNSFGIISQEASVGHLGFTCRGQQSCWGCNISSCKEPLLVLCCHEKLWVSAAFPILRSHESRAECLSLTHTPPPRHFGQCGEVCSTSEGRRTQKSWLPLSGYPQPTFFTWLKKIPPFCQTKKAWASFPIFASNPQHKHMFP